MNNSNMRWLNGLGFILLATVMMPAQASNVSMNVGVRPQITTWIITDPDADESVSARAQQIGLDFQVKRKQFYFAIGIAGGDFTFDGAGPARPDGFISTQDKTKINRGELDLVLGYYFWRPVSFFAGVKSISNTWEEDDYKVEYSGLGLGVSANHRFSRQWAMFGSFSVLSTGAEDDSGKIGKGSGVSLEIGGLFAINPKNILALTTNTQFQRNTYDVDDDGNTDMKQNHRTNKLVFRYYYVF